MAELRDVALEANRLDRITQAYRTILEELGVAGEDGTADTPARAAKAILELTSGYSANVAGLFRTFAADGYGDMVVVDNIPFSSLCEHHILPFTGQAHVVYVPQGHVIGLSKIPRLVDAYSQRLQIQERLTQQIADALVQYLDPLGVMVVVEAEHMCATLRGVKKPGTMMRTSALRGIMLHAQQARAEALSLIGKRL